MSEKEIIDQLIDSIVNMELEEAKNACNKALANKIDPFKIIQDGIVKAVNIVGDKFEAEEYYLAELIMAGEILKQTMKIIEPHVSKQERKSLGKVVIGTGKGDMHDIGKNIVSVFLGAEGFEIIDLGVDVSNEKFIQAIKDEKPKIIAISTLLSSTMPEIKTLMKELENEGLKDQVKVIVGGSPITQEFVKSIGAEGFARNAIDGVNICKRWSQE